MTHIKNNQGYALLLVLLMIVLFISVAAVFVNTSISHSKQEIVLDKSNQSLVLAEMGIQHLETLFNQKYNVLRNDIYKQVQDEIQLVKLECQIDSPPAKCYDQNYINEKIIDAKESSLNLFKSGLIQIINELKLVTNSPDLSSSYKVNEITVTPNINTLDFSTEFLEIKAYVFGEIDNSSGEKVEKQLITTFNVKLVSFFDDSDPITLLSRPLTQLEIETELLSPPVTSISCDVIHAYKDTMSPPYNCNLEEGSDFKLESLITVWKNAGMDLSEINVVVENWVESICTSNCNSIDLEGVSIFSAEQEINLRNNMNGFADGEVYFNGVFTIGNNLNNLNKNEDGNLIMVFRGLNTDNNIQNMTNTTMVILGQSPILEENFKWGSNFSLDAGSKMCINADMIHPNSLAKIVSSVSFGTDTEFHYFTENQSLVLNPVKRPSNTGDFVTSRSADFLNFLNECGIDVDDLPEVLISYPRDVNIEPEVNVDVIYNP
ncbi:hypothetical protein ACFPYN_09885 [Paenisporosarcina macmurdoensis]|uniref:Type 4 fimbrial biogenesis protein PilX N-terminal domain-containing protein n=1 Tax=Paenisporosarcina macmurdoensis TaxID=212659 RepID=A0ABW1L8M8_9BACL